MGNSTEEEPIFMFNDELVARLLPDGLSEFKNLVGGINPNKQHKDKFRVESSKRTIYKILSRQRKGFNEALFYHLVFNENIDPLLSKIRDFVPAYRGLFHLPSTGQYFIAMQNAQYGMQRPNSMDVKLGQRSYVPDASSSKRRTEEAKYLWRKELGFFITGLKVDGAFFDRSYGSSLNPDNVFEKGICLFLDGSEKDEKAKRRKRSILGRCFLERVGNLKEWFESQRVHRFIASSLLLCYDWYGFDTDPLISFHLIDFARWYKVPEPSSTKPSLDENVLFGIRKLHSLFLQATEEDL